VGAAWDAETEDQRDFSKKTRFQKQLSSLIVGAN